MLRLDLYLVKNNFFTGRERAKRAISGGHVCVNGKVITKPSFCIAEGDEVLVNKVEDEYVGRGGYKLAAALQMFSFSVADLIAVDLGASTGGFTDCLLKNRAKKVYAVDVGTNQLVSDLRENPAVCVMEQTNARVLTSKSFPDTIDLVTADLSFISLTLVFPAIANILPQNGYAICLVKPQFEAGRGNVGKNGIVRDAKVHRQVLENLISEAGKVGLQTFALTYSPITGGDGNIEFLIGMKKSDEMFSAINIESVVTMAHKTHRKQGGEH